MLPFKLTPSYKDYIWGGNKLKKYYNKQTDLDVVAESWELSAHDDGSSVICGGEFNGMLFSDFIKKYPKSVGEHFEKTSEFPVLIKLIDAKNSLSVQVHPDDEFARKYRDGNGKTEMWYILDCEPGAYLYFGFRYKITPEEFQRRIEQNNITDVLRKIYVKKGDVFFIKAGTIHAIGAGIIIAEIQQNSNTTYRVYDYDRVGKDGKKRELHIDKASMVTKLARAELYEIFDFSHIETKIFTEKMLVECGFFIVKHFSLDGTVFVENNKKIFFSYLCIAGKCVFSYRESILFEAEQGDSIFIPSDCPRIKISGICEFIISTVPVSGKYKAT